MDLYKPFPINEDVAIEENILTVRAVVVGVILGCLVNASNLYLGNVPRYLQLLEDANPL